MATLSIFVLQPAKIASILCSLSTSPDYFLNAHPLGIHLLSFLKQASKSVSTELKVGINRTKPFVFNVELR